MKIQSIYVIVAIILIFGTLLSSEKSTVTEPSTGMKFQDELTFQFEGTEYSLALTGLTVRKKLMFKGYAIAHYMEKTVVENLKEAYRTALADSIARQITIEFCRNISANKIQGGFRNDFKKNGSPEEIKQIQPLIDQFLTVFKDGIKKNERIIIRYLPGGGVLVLSDDENNAEATAKHLHLSLNKHSNVIFVRTLWSIWFGEKSTVDREKLVERIIITE